MAIDISDKAGLKSKVSQYLDEFPGDLICARQIWYEGLCGEGAASAETVLAIEAALDSVPGWANTGRVRYEKFGEQNSWKKVL